MSLQFCHQHLLCSLRLSPSGKFYRKVHFIRTLADLSSHLSLEEGLIPAPVVRADAALHPRQPPQQKYKPGEDKSQQGV